jgi:hypothetical protein
MDNEKWQIIEITGGNHRMPVGNYSEYVHV